MNRYLRICILAFLMVFMILASSTAIFASSGEFVTKGQTGINVAELVAAMNTPVALSSATINTTVSAAVYNIQITNGNTPTNIVRGTTRNFTAQVRQGTTNLNPQPTINWSVTSNAAGVTINSQGVLTVPANAPTGATITVTASSANATPTVVTLTIVAGVQATVTFNLGPNMNITVDNQQYTNINRFTRQRAIGANFGTLPSVSRSNFNLEGWFRDGDIRYRFNANSEVTGNMSVSALWRPTGATRTITFDPNGGTWPNGPWPGNLNASGGGTADRQITIGNNSNLAALGFSGNATAAFNNFNMIPNRNGFDFDGWERSNGSILHINDTFNSNITVTALWIPRNAITLTFNPRGGTWPGGGGTGNRTEHIPRHSSFSSEFGSNGLANRIGTPTRSGYRFDGWVIGNTTTSFTNTTVVNPSGNATSMTINATWSRTASPPPQQPQQPQPPQQPPTSNVQFRDVPANAWFAHYVNTVVTRSLFHGVGDNRFAPNENMTRAMFVQVIHNMAGQPASAATVSFGDVPSNAWFAQAVNWASSQGIVHGVGPNSFAPNTPITREQMAVMLLRYAENRNVTLPVGTPVTFADQARISSWARDSVNVISAAGIVSGRTGGNFAPLATATRAEVAAIFSRYLQVTGQ